MVSTLSILRAAADDWGCVRSVRLRALADAPEAFGSTLAETESRPPSHWQERLSDPRQAFFVARLDVREVGLAVGAEYEGNPGAAGLFSMWVAPEARGHGLGEALIEAVAAWARDAGFDRILLDVGDTNLPAVALYERCGFVPTGRSGSLPAPREHVAEHERVRVL